MDVYFFIPEIFGNNQHVKLIYRICPNYTCEIIDIYSYNQNRGNGTIVYKNFEIFVKEKYETKNIYAFTRFTNEAAIRWYKRMEFETTVVPNYYWDEPEFKAIILSKNI